MCLLDLSIKSRLWGAPTDGKTAVESPEMIFLITSNLCRDEQRQKKTQNATAPNMTCLYVPLTPVCPEGSMVTMSSIRSGSGSGGQNTKAPALIISTFVRKHISSKCTDSILHPAG